MRYYLCVILVILKTHLAFTQECNGTNEAYDACGVDAYCTSPNTYRSTDCYPGCYCTSGYVRDENNVCILASDCKPPICPDPNQVYDPCGADGNCTNPTAVRDSVCRQGCYCTEGYVRDPSNNCILPDSCNAITCGVNEVANICPKFCTFENDCQTQFGGLVKECGSPDGYVCEPRCDCKGKTFRAAGSCVVPELCPVNGTCTRPNELFNGCGTCDGFCYNGNPVCESNCTTGCFCEPGYVREVYDGVCILPSNCPNTTKCPGPSEVFKLCGSCDGSCDNPNPVCPAVCVTGCFCEPGYVRDVTLQCIPQEKCTVILESPTVPLIPIYTTTANNPVSSPSTATSTTPETTARGPTCPGPNEAYSTCGGCDGTCDNPNPICPRMCHIGCFCNQGYLRNSAGKCILPADCKIATPVKNKCKHHDKRRKRCKNRYHPKHLMKNAFKRLLSKNNEVFKTCGTCDPTCEFPNLICNLPCQMGFFCKDGYVRNHEGKCVHPSSCSSVNDKKFVHILNTMRRHNGKLCRMRVAIPNKKC